MNEFSVLIGGKAGFGIDKSSLIIAGILNRLGYRLYVYRDYPSLIRGGHTFSIIRASGNKVAAHLDKVDFILALNQDAVDLHKIRRKETAIILYDSDSVKSDGVGLSLGKMVKEENAPDMMRNSGLIGAFCRVSGIEWGVLEEVFRKNFSGDINLNLKIARRAYNSINESVKIDKTGQNSLPLLTGNEATGLGLVNSGLKAYIAYPMTPSSPVLHFLANIAGDFPLQVIHPESEIAVMLMASGFSYCGKKVAVGTSGGGFCLMTEGFSFAAMAELPIVVILGQRPGPSTGLPTYSSQTELGFAMNAGQGEFPRFIVAPGDAEEAYYWSQVALNVSWKFQVPSIILSDKTLGEGTYSFDMALTGDVKEENPALWDGKAPYRRYLDTETGVSPLAFAPQKDTVIKINSYEHDESGITTEDAVQATKMQDKRLRKEGYITKYLENYDTVKVYGRRDSTTALLCWGSAKGPVVEVAQKEGLKVIQVLSLLPFPLDRFKRAMEGTKRVVSVENNATGQLVSLINRYGFNVDAKILKYDGRPFSVDELTARLKEVTR